MATVKKNKELTQEYGRALLERIADKEKGVVEQAAHPEWFETHAPCLMKCQGNGAKMKLVELAFGMAQTGMFRLPDGKLAGFEECVAIIGMVFGEDLGNAAQLKRDLLKRKEPSAFLRTMARAIDNFREEYDG